jgi:purine-binding chemotaxis protein CheW
MPDEAELRLVCFELRGQEFAFPIAHVRETLAVQPITRVFLTPACLAGVFSLRGEVVPAVDVGVLLGLAPAVVGDATRIVILRHALGTAGVLVDRISEQRRLDQALDAPPPSLPAEVAALLRGVAATSTGTVRVLDADAIFDAEPLRVLRESAS